ncbi:zeatin O-xylosyltransferase-like [Solanum dulcamara]|uniref:zeatin O-xylosyltransferase-like n=1 Tax=Solanum dulcamara TaxID=45834 RepID=UPI002485547F|nr:zeatin O-xylosyltransferase-like [Solanum dulcamara]
MDNNLNLANLKQQLGDEVVVVMVPFQTQTHLDPFLQFACLIASYGLSVHYLSLPNYNNDTRSRATALNPSDLVKIHFHDLQMTTTPLDPDIPSEVPKHFHLMWNVCMRLRESTTSFLRDISSKSTRVVMIHDCLMSYNVQDISSFHNAESYIFNPVISAFGMYCDHIFPIVGLPIPLEQQLLQRLPSSEGWYCDEIMRISSFLVQFIGNSSAGDINNTSKVMEGTNTFIDLLGIGQNKKQWAVGPVLRPIKKEKNRFPCLDWLDKQPPKSVLFVSYEILISFSDEQIKELAMGLELSKQKFIWLLNEPDNGDIYMKEDPYRKFEFHAGFEERLNGIGLLLRDWAPQTEILAHSSIGGFLSACDWTACVETITLGVPIIAWPTHSDHPKNGFLLTEILKTGLIIKEWDQKRDEVVTASTVDNVVRKLMASEEGDEIRKRAKELGETVRQSTEKGGVSRMELDSFIEHITR